MDGPPPLRSPTGPDITVDTATVHDRSELARLIGAAFGDPPERVADRLESATGTTRSVRCGESLVGALRVELDGDDAGIYGFAVDPALQGRGIGLYTSLGFVPVATEDYYELPLRRGGTS